jgi:tRNA-dihydrouridine synthase
MKYYFAPLEGLTGYLYRNAHHTYFKQVDKYFSPFIVANQNGLKNREWKDILPENNEGVSLVPQLLTNKAKDFIHTSKEIRKMGYQEINLNLGCPSGTVVSKFKGSGFLGKKKELEEFFEEIFSADLPNITVKTRIGRYQPEEFYELIDIYNKFPISELIIHPRTREDYYKNKPNLEIFKDAIKLCNHPVCYNGDIFTLEDYHKFVADFPDTDRIMMGRGLLMNPGLIGEIEGDNVLTKQLLKEFHDRLYHDYHTVLSGDKNVLYKMKELWHYMIFMFPDHEKYSKKIKKSERLKDYDEIVANLFQEEELVKNEINF